MAGSLILHLTFSFAPPQRDKATQCLACRVTLSTAECVVTQMIMKTSPGHARLDTLGPPVQALQMTTPTTHYGVSPRPTPSLPTPTPNPIDWLLSPQISRCFQMFLFLGSLAVWVDRVRWDTSLILSWAVFVFASLFVAVVLSCMLSWLTLGKQQWPWSKTFLKRDHFSSRALHWSLSAPLFVQVNPWSSTPPPPSSKPTSAWSFGWF